MAGITLKSYSSHGQLLIFLILINHVLVKIISARNKQINSFPWFIDGWMDGLMTDIYCTEVNKSPWRHCYLSSILYQL